MNELTTSIPKVFFQRFQAFPIRQQVADEFRQRLVDDLFLIIGQRLVDLFHQILICHQLGDELHKESLRMALEQYR